LTRGNPPRCRLAEYLVQQRRALHAIPELGFELPRTRAHLAAALAEQGLEPDSLGEGLVVDLGDRGPLFAWRADMDALPVQEATGADYASTHPGRMHACGHDAHMAVALGIARRFSMEGAALPCRLRLIFQPAEERAEGARRMIDAGVLEGVRGIAGLHVWTGGSTPVPNGVIASRAGTLMASCDFFEIRFTGQQTHGAFPHAGTDALLAACQCVAALQTARYSGVDPAHGAVLSVGMIHAGTAPNVLPRRAVLNGSARATDPGDRERIEQKVRRLAEGIGLASGTDVAITWNRMAPATVNDPAMAALAEAAAVAAHGPGAFLWLERPTLAGEDFGEFLERVPGVMVLLGCGDPGRGITEPLHHPRFELDEQVLARAVGFVEELLRRWAGST
jgi:amidohydrolase